jgi:hypothetical protein
VGARSHAVFAYGAFGTRGGGYRVPFNLIPRVIRDVLHPITQPLGIEWDDPERTYIPWSGVLTPDGQPIQFQAWLIDPKGGGTPGPYGLDKPRASFYEYRPHNEPGPDNDPGSRVPCNKRFEPTSYGDLTPGRGPGALDDVWFDVSCDDGLGYDYYRVHFYQYGVYPDFSDSAFAATGGDPKWSDGSHGFLATGTTFPAEMAQMAVCGHRPTGGWDCYSNPDVMVSGHIYPDIKDLRIIGYL